MLFDNRLAPLYLRTNVHSITLILTSKYRIINWHLGNRNIFAVYNMESIFCKNNPVRCKQTLKPRYFLEFPLCGTDRPQISAQKPESKNNFKQPVLVAGFCCLKRKKDRTICDYFWIDWKTISFIFCKLLSGKYLLIKVYEKYFSVNTVASYSCICSSWRIRLTRWTLRPQRQHLPLLQRALLLYSQTSRRSLQASRSQHL